MKNVESPHSTDISFLVYLINTTSYADDYARLWAWNTEKLWFTCSYHALLVFGVVQAVSWATHTAWWRSCRGLAGDVTAVLPVGG